MIDNQPLDERSFKRGWHAAMFVAELWVARNIGGSDEEVLAKANELCCELDRCYAAAIDEAKGA